MSGLRRICKALGGMTVTGNDGASVKYLWDYVANEPVPESEMPFGSERHKLSERARWLQYPPRGALQCAARACEGCDVCRAQKVAV